MRFVGIETVSLLDHLHKLCILYRDLKPDNLMLDAKGHVRLIDFGTAKQGDVSTGKQPRSSEECGTKPYLAPEVAGIGRKESYDKMCDWFSFGVMLYELTDRKYPFGDDPEYEDMSAEFVQPKLLDESGHEVSHLYDLLSGLLDWDPTKRLGNERLGSPPIQEHAYWGGADWELADQGRLPSPLKSRVAADAVPAPTADGSADQISRSLNMSQSFQRRADDAEGDEEQELVDREREFYVEGWSYVSEYALAQEYIDSAGESVSIV